MFSHSSSVRYFGLLTLKIYESILRFNTLLCIFPLEFQKSQIPSEPRRIRKSSSRLKILAVSAMNILLTFNCAVQVLSTAHLYFNLERMNLQTLFHFQVAVLSCVGVATSWTVFKHKSDLALFLNLLTDVSKEFQSALRSAQSSQSPRDLVWYLNPLAITACLSASIVCFNLLAIQILTASFYYSESSFYFLILSKFYPAIGYPALFVFIEAVKLTITIFLVFCAGMFLVIPYVALQIWLKFIIETVHKTRDAHTTRALYQAVERASILNNAVFGSVFQPTFFCFHTVNTTFLIYMLIREDVEVNLWIISFMIPGVVFVAALAVISFLQLSKVGILSQNILHHVQQLHFHGVIDGRKSAKIRYSHRRRWIQGNFRHIGIIVGSYGYFRPSVVVAWCNTVLSNLLLLLK